MVVDKYDTVVVSLIELFPLFVFPMLSVQCSVYKECTEF